MKYSGINLIRDEQELYTKTTKHYGETKDLNKWREMLCSWIMRLNNVKTSILL